MGTRASGFILSVWVAGLVWAAEPEKTPPPPPNQPPEFSEKEFSLPEARRGTPYTASLPSDAAVDPEKETLKFALLPGGPSWLKLSADGKFQGTPGPTDRGTQRWQIEVRDKKNAAATCAVVVQIKNRAPVWAKQQVLGSGREGDAFALSVGAEASDPDRDALTFRRAGGPQWLDVDARGKISGTPPLGSNGNEEAEIEITDGEDKATLRVALQIREKNYPPACKLQPFYTTQEREVFTLTLSETCEDKNETDKLRYQAKAAPPWVQLTEAGVLTAKPEFKQVGEHTLNFSITDGENTVADKVVLKVARNPRPPVWAAAEASFNLKSRDAFKASIGKQARDLDGVALKFSKASGPEWLTVSEAGDLAGTPPDAAAGTQELTVRAASDVASAEKSFVFQITKKNYPPQLVKPLQMAIKERQDLRWVLTEMGVVQDADGEPLTFSGKPPAWVTLTPTGEMELKPRYANIGEHRFALTAKDKEATVEIPVHLTVQRDPRAPEWVAEELSFDAQTREPVKLSLAGKARDLDGKAFQYSKVTGPEWLTVTPKGELTGTPTDLQAGSFTLVVNADNGERAAPKQVRLQVRVKNHDPVIHERALHLSVKERTQGGWDLTEKLYTDDSDGQTLTFTLKNKSDWFDLTPQGRLIANPVFKNIGKHTLSFTISDGEAKASGNIELEVLRNPRPPEWSQEPLVFKIQTREPFKASLAPSAKDLDGLPLTFSKVLGPEWLQVSAQGVLSGTPNDEQAGSPTATVKVSNRDLGVDKQVSFEIRIKNRAPIVMSEGLSFTMKERATQKWDLNIPTRVKDLDGQPLKFSLKEKSDFVTLSPLGEFTASPVYKNIGKHTLAFEVTDGELTTPGKISFTVERDPRAPEWNAEPLAFDWQTREPVKGSVASHAKDLDGKPIQFSKVLGPEWLQVSPKGELQGTPTDLQAGSFTLKVRADNHERTADTDVAIHVKVKNHEPVVHSNALVFTAKERAVTGWSLNQKLYAEDIDGQDLVFDMKNKPEWVQLLPTGQLTVQPQFKQIGKHTFPITVSDGLLTTPGTVTLTIERDPRPPVWAEAPVHYSIQTREPFKASVTAHAKDLDGLPIQYSKVLGPEWLTVSPKGDLSGTPTDEQAGTPTLTVRAQNNERGADKNFTFEIRIKNRPPVIFAKELEFTLKERSVQTYNLAVPTKTMDPDGQRLTYSLKEKADWLTLSPNGELVVRPAFKQIGKHTLSVDVSDGDLTTTGKLTLVVERDPRPPEWGPEPMTFSLQTREPFKASVAARAKDLDGLPMTFSKVEGPDWLTVSPKGDLGGQPTDDQAGRFPFVLRAQNAERGANNQGMLDIKIKNRPPVVFPNQLEFTAKERASTTFDLSDPKRTMDPDGQKLQYTLKDKNDWAIIASTGQLTVQPQFKQIGKHTLTVDVSDGELKAEAKVTLTVERDPRPPVWVVPVLSYKLKSLEAVDIPLGPQAKDLDGLPIHFEKKKGPSWVEVSKEGKFTGVPQDDDVGTDSAVFLVANDEKSSEIRVTFEVKAKNRAPFWSLPRLQLGNARAGEPFQTSVGKFASDPEKTQLVFEKVRGPGWLTVLPTGVIAGRPGRSETGTAELVIRAKDADGESADVAGDIRLLRPLSPPRPNHNPIRLPAAYPGELFAFHFINVFADDTLHYRKLSGPSWLNVSAVGALAGVPPQGKEDYQFTFEVTNGRDTAQFTANGKVSP